MPNMPLTDYEVHLVTLFRRVSHLGRAAVILVLETMNDALTAQTPSELPPPIP